MIILPRFFFVAMWTQALCQWNSGYTERADDPLKKILLWKLLRSLKQKMKHLNRNLFPNLSQMRSK